MFGHRRRGRSSSTPPTDPSHNALIAASAVYRPKAPANPSLAAAAAGAALRHATASPPPPEQRIGSIPTKRMLQRRESYSSVTSDPPNSPVSGSGGRPETVRRRSSSGSLTKRRFRKEKTPPPPEGESVRRTKSSGTMMGRGTMRGASAPPPPTRRTLSPSPSDTHSPVPHPKQLSMGISSGKYADSVTSFSSDLDSIVEDENGSGSQQQQVQQNWRRNNRQPLPVVETFEEEDEDDNTIQHRRHEPTKRSSHVQTTNDKSATRKPSPPPLSLKPPSSPTRSARSARSPTRTQFGTATADMTKHSPPARSVSPAKSALKHAPSSPVPRPADSPPRRAHVRVSFSDEESIVSSPTSRPAILSPEDYAEKPKLPVFGSVRNKPFDQAQGRRNVEKWNQGQHSIPDGRVMSISPPSSEFEPEEDAMEKATTRKEPVQTLTPPEVPELVLTQPTPREEKEGCKVHLEVAAGSKVEVTDVEEKEKGGEKAMSELPAAPGFFPVTPLEKTETEAFSIPTIPTAISSTTTTTASTPEDGDHDSIYSDAYESLPPAATVLSAPALPTIATTLKPALSPPTSPTSPTYAAFSNHHHNPLPLNNTPRPPSPPLPPDFTKPTPTPTRRRSLTPPPSTRRRSSTTKRRSKTAAAAPPPSSDDSDNESVSSFRCHPRQASGHTFRSNMRSTAPSAGGRRYSSDSSASPPPTTRMRSSLRSGSGGKPEPWKSRFADDSDSDVPRSKMGKLGWRGRKVVSPPPPVKGVSPVPPMPVMNSGSPKTLRKKEEMAQMGAGAEPVSTIEEHKKHGHGFWRWGSLGGGPKMAGDGRKVSSGSAKLQRRDTTGGITSKVEGVKEVKEEGGSGVRGVQFGNGELGGKANGEGGVKEKVGKKKKWWKF